MVTRRQGQEVPPGRPDDGPVSRACASRGAAPTPPGRHCGARDPPRIRDSRSKRVLRTQT